MVSFKNGGIYIQDVPISGGTSDHGLLTGLNDDDHVQYPIGPRPEIDDTNKIPIANSIESYTWEDGYNVALNYTPINYNIENDIIGEHIAAIDELITNLGTSSHASTHEIGGDDQLDGYNVALNYTPINYNIENDIIGEHIAAIDYNFENYLLGPQPADPTDNGKIPIAFDGEYTWQNIPGLIFDTFSATDGQTEFILSQAPGSSATIMIVDGIVISSSSYSVSDTTVTYTGTSLTVGQRIDFYFGIGSGGGIKEYTISPTDLVADVNDYAPTGWHTATIVRLSADGYDYDITGFAAPIAESIRKTLINVGEGTITLKTEDTNSIAANRIITSPGSGFIMFTNDAAELFYDEVSLRWRTI